MSYACHKCGSTIEEGTAFCPHCGAPQIRVAMPEGDPSPSFTPGTPAEMQPPAEPVPLSVLPPRVMQVPWRHAIGPVLVSAVLILAGSMLQLGVLWNLMVIAGGGALAVALYRRRVLSGRLSAAVGAKIGAVTGFVTCAIPSALLVLGCAVNGSEMRQKLVEYFQENQSRMPDAQSRQTITTIIQKMNTPDGFATFIVVALAFSFIMFIVLAAAGGAISASFLHRDRAPH